MTRSRLILLQLSTVSVGSLAGLCAATQWLARGFGYQPALGAPIWQYNGIVVYRPWSLFVWWYRFGKVTPHLFDKAGALAAASAVAAAGIAGLAAILAGERKAAPTTYGSARWSTLREIRGAGLMARAGVFLGQFGGAYLRHDGPEHVLAVAPTRSGKGVGLVVPTLLSWTGSVLVHDIKGENWRITSGWRARFSHCLLFDPTDIRSAHYNPLLEVRRGASEVRDVQNIADILVDPEGALERRNHWEKTSHSLLVGAILHVLYVERDKSLAGVAHFLSDPGRTFVATLEAMLHANHLGTADEPLVHPVVAACARELLNKADNERSGVLSTALSFLGLYRDPTIAAITSRCDWRIDDLVSAERPVSLYLVVPPSDITRTRSLIRLVLNQIGRRLTEQLDQQGGDRRHQLLLMLDEFPALGRMDFFESTLAFMAGYGIRAFLIAQSLNQLVQAYGEANSILDNCHIRIAFATNDERTAARISHALGTATEQRMMQNHSGPRSALWLPNVSVSQQETARPLLTPGEVMQLPADEELVLLSSLAPIRAKKLRYFEDANFRSRCLPAPTLIDGRYADRPPEHGSDWSATTIATPTPQAPRQVVPQPISATASLEARPTLHPERTFERRLGMEDVERPFVPLDRIPQ